MTVLDPTAHDRAPAGPAPPDERPTPMAPAATGRLATVAVGAVVVAGLLVRLRSSSALWLDEAITVDIARQPLGDLPTALGRDGHPPLFYALLHLWTAVGGTGDGWVRLLPSLCAAACLPLAWALGRRLGGRRVADVSLVLVASSPFVARYATEARMYALLGLLGLAGHLAVLRALESPTGRRLAAVALLAAANVLTHYWGIWLVAVALAAVVVGGAHDRRPRRTTTRVAVALAVGGLALVPWVPVLARQAAHTGTPWARSVEPLDATFDTLLDLGGGKWVGGRLLAVLLLLLVGAALLARPAGRWELVVDLRTVAGARAEIVVAAATLAVGLLVAVATGSAYQPRYAAGVVPLLLVAAAVGVTRLPGRVLPTTVVAVLAVVGLVGSVRAASRPRTQAAEVAAAIRAEAGPDDVVGYCPDQLRPAVQRELGPTWRAATLPGGSPPGRIDWTDYRDRVDRADPDAFGRRLLDLAGASGGVWLVAADGYRGFDDACADVEAVLTAARGPGRTVVDTDRSSYERSEVVWFPAP